MYGTNGSIQAQESAETWSLEAPASFFQGKLLDEKPEDHVRGASRRWGGLHTYWSSSCRLFKAWWSVVVFYALLTLLPSICSHSAGTRVKKGLESRRLAGFAPDDENSSPRSNSPDWTQLCIELGPWFPLAQLPDDTRASPRIVEEVLMALEKDSTSDTASTPSTAATFPPHDVAPWTPQSHSAVYKTQLEEDSDEFARATLEMATRQAQSLADQTFSPRQPLQRTSEATYAGSSHRQEYASPWATAAPAVSNLHEGSTPLQHAYYPTAQLQVQPTSSLSAGEWPCQPSRGLYMAASYAIPGHEQQYASSGATGASGGSDLREGESSSHAQLHPAHLQAQPPSSLFAYVTPIASRWTLDKGDASASYASTSQEQQSASSGGTEASTESHLRPSGDPNVKHPFVRLPSVRPGVFVRPFRVPDWRSMGSGPKRQVHVLRRIRELLLKAQLNQQDVFQLIHLAEGATSQMLTAIASGVSERRPYLACENLGRRFLTLNALHCISTTLNLNWEKQQWWKEITGRIPSEYRSHVYTSPDNHTEFTRQLTFDLAAAVNLYKSGLSPSDEVIIDLKRRLFCMKQSPYFSRDASWEAWRDDDQMWQRS
ncbi:hypothetical protein Esti_002926 [Eimeria stiedai]